MEPNILIGFANRLEAVADKNGQLDNDLREIAIHQVDTLEKKKKLIESAFKKPLRINFKKDSFFGRKNSALDGTICLPIDWNVSYSNFILRALDCFGKLTHVHILDLEPIEE